MKKKLSMNQEFVEYNKELDYYREKYKKRKSFLTYVYQQLWMKKIYFTKVVVK